MTIDTNGRNHTSAGVAGGGQFAQERTPEPVADALNRDGRARRRLLPYDELGVQLRRISEANAAVEMRQDLQDALRLLRAVNPSVASVLIDDQNGHGGINRISAAWDDKGKDISVGDWLGTGKDVDIAQYSSESNADFFCTEFLYDEEPFRALATPDPDQLAIRVVIDQALAVNPNNPDAVTLTDEVVAIKQGSEFLAEALESVRLSESHALLDQIESAFPGLPDDVVSVQLQVSGRTGREVDLNVWLLNENGDRVAHDNESVDRVYEMGWAVETPLYLLRDRGDFAPASLDGRATLTLEVKR